MPASNTILSETAAALIVCICLHELYARYRARKLPPGVSGLFSLFKVPREKPWLKLLQFNQKYGVPSHNHEILLPILCRTGDIASVSFWGFNVIVVSSANIAADLLDKRGINYADRPRSVMAGELAGWAKVMLLCNYTDRLRTQRKWLAHNLGSHAVVAKFHRMIEVETRRTLRSVLEDPDRLRTHVRKYVPGSFVPSLTYD